MELSSDKVNLILIFLTLGQIVFYCKMTQVEMTNVHCILLEHTNSMFQVLEGKLEYLLYPLLYPNFKTLIFNIRSDFDLYMGLKQTINSVKSYALRLLNIKPSVKCNITALHYATHINACKINIKPKSPIKCMHLG